MKHLHPTPGKRKRSAQHVRPDVACGSFYSSFSPHNRATKHPVEHDLKRLKPGHDRAIDIHHQIDSSGAVR